MAVSSPFAARRSCVDSPRSCLRATRWLGSDILLTVNENALVELITLSKPVPLSFTPLGRLAFLHERDVVMAPTTAASVVGCQPLRLRAT